jgi:hypothetical protein
MTVIPEACERFRGSVSLGLDGMLSTFETRLLERHLETCADCRGFAAAVTEQTAQLRTAALEAAPRVAAAVDVPAAGRQGRSAVLAAAGAAAVVAAMLSFVSTGRNHSSTETSGARNALLAVVPSQPTANPNIEVPRVEVVSPASADGPVRGYYGVPA